MCNTACLTHHDQSIPNLVSSHLFEVQKFPGKCEEIHFMIPPARYVNGTFARQWHTFHHGNQLPSLTCSHYHMSRKLPGKLQETSLSQPFFPSNKGRYACHIRRSFPEGVLLTTQTTLCSLKDFRALARPSTNNN